MVPKLCKGQYFKLTSLCRLCIQRLYLFIGNTHVGEWFWAATLANRELRLLEPTRASFFFYAYQLHPRKGRLHKNILRALHQGVLAVRTGHWSAPAVTSSALTVMLLTFKWKHELNCRTKGMAPECNKTIGYSEIPTEAAVMLILIMKTRF